MHFSHYYYPTTHMSKSPTVYWNCHPLPQLEPFPESCNCLLPSPPRPSPSHSFQNLSNKLWFFPLGHRQEGEWITNHNWNLGIWLLFCVLVCLPTIHGILLPVIPQQMYIYNKKITFSIFLPYNNPFLQYTQFQHLPQLFVRTKKFWCFFLCHITNWFQVSKTSLN